MLLRYYAGEAMALAVVDAQNTAKLARIAVDDGLGTLSGGACKPTNCDRIFLAMLRIYVLVLTACLALLASCSGKSKEAEAGGETAAAAPVEVAPVTRKTISHVITSEAVLYPINQANIMPKISAPVQKF